MRINTHYKITLVFAAITAVILLGIYSYLRLNLRDQIYSGIREDIFRELSLSRVFAETSLERDGSPANVKRIASEISRELGLRVTMISAEGKVQGDSGLKDKELESVENHLYRPEVQQALAGGIGESRRFSTTLRTDMLYAAVAFGPEGHPSGVIRLAMPLGEIEKVSDHLKSTLIFSFFAAFALISIAGYAASLFISRPLREMSLFAGSMAAGDFSKRIDIRSEDEVGDLAAAFTDMAGQVKARMEDITSMRSRLEAVLLSMFDGVMVVDAGGNILLMNMPLKELLLVKGPVEGRRPLEVVRNVEVQDIAERALKLATGVESREISVILDGERTLFVHATPVVRDGSTEGAVLVFHDITGLRRLENIRKDFVANVSHELRTPISSIKGYAETLIEGALEDKDNAVDFLRIISSEAERLASLVNDLLDLSKIESGRIELELEPCDISLIVRKALSGQAKQAAEAGVRVSAEIPEALPRILADEKMITQVLCNLLDNAVKYNERGGNVTVSAHDKGDLIEIGVSDTGSGIPAEDIPRIFERFYRVDKARSRELGGTGLGLSIVKHIVQAHGGDVTVSSVLGKGSTFSFTIPKA